MEMRRVIAFILLLIVRTYSQLFFRVKYLWLTETPDQVWDKARLIIFLNHTSLYEPLFSQCIPTKTLWRLAGHFNIPGADVTLDRPIVGLFWKLMIPKISKITRKKDESWTNYLQTINPDSIIMIAPEGRMKRPNGLDKNGQKMTVRGGVADIIQGLESGGLIICLSGGLHHVQAPGQFFPNHFREIKMNFAYFDIPDYKSKFSGTPKEIKLQIIQDLQNRLEKDCPT